jgi:hypothetical protein
MTAMNKRVDANIVPHAYTSYGHLIDVSGSEVWTLQMVDVDASLCRTMSYQKTNRNLLQWMDESDTITCEEMRIYINDQMFYGMFPSIDIASQEGAHETSKYWNNATLYERDRDMFKKCVPLIKTISAAGWESIPYATCDNPDIKFERYGYSDEGLYYTVGNSGSDVVSGVLSIDLTKLGFDGTVVEVKELVTSITYTQEVMDGELHIAVTSLEPHDTLVYKIISR